jgi:SAM-dependent MidA family methyltransferase
MTALSQLLVARIRAGGPITLAEFMAECLLHPEHGYYTRGRVFGTAGDFVTAPEISQMFGELLGLALAQAWIDQGRPRDAVLAELGPGRGTLMADALRAAAVVPGFHEAVSPVLVEASPVLRAEQARRLAGQGAGWVGAPDALPAAPLFLVANEFFDALPIRQFRRAGDGWAETVVGVEGDRLVFGLAPAAPLAALAGRLADTRPGDIVEICPAAPAAMEAVAGRIACHGGAAIVVDYGGWRSLGDTLQAVAGHQPCDPLAAPGEADLTAHVDFEPLAAAAEAAGARVLPPVPQGALLQALGIEARAEVLARTLAGPARDSHFAALRRLTSRDEMGTLFKALGVVPRGAPPLAGFPT